MALEEEQADEDAERNSGLQINELVIRCPAALHEKVITNLGEAFSGQFAGVRKVQIALLQREKRDVKHHLNSNLMEARKARERELTIEKLQTQNLELRRQTELWQQEKKSLERELTKAMIKAKCMGAVLAEEWKDFDEKVMPVKRWLEEKRYLQGDIERLKGKLAKSERAAKMEAQLKDKLKSRFRSLEECLKHVLTLSTSQNFRYSYSIGIPGQHSIPLKAASLTASKLSELQQPNFVPESGNNTNGSDDCEPEIGGVQEGRGEGMMASGVLYEIVKEVVNLQNILEGKDELLGAKDDQIKLLQRKVEDLTKALEKEVNSIGREAAEEEKEDLEKPQITKKTKACSIVQRLWCCSTD